MIITIIPGKFGSLAALHDDGHVTSASQPYHLSTLKTLLKSWTGGKRNVTAYVDEFYMMNTPRLDFAKIDMAEYSHYIGLIKGICYAMFDYVVPVDTAEILFKDDKEPSGYTSGLDVDSRAYDIATKSYPHIKEGIDNRCDIFYSLAPALALLSRVSDDKYKPTKFESVKEPFPESIFL